MNHDFHKIYARQGGRRSLPVSIGAFIVATFLFFRPITVSFHHIGSISILDLYGIAVSFLILLGIVINLPRIKLDSLSFVILFFIFYSLMSFFWGGSYAGIAKTILPFLPFFLTRAVLDENAGDSFLWVLIIGYIVPVIGSVAMILLGLSETMTTGSMVERQAGLASGVHTLSHLMLFFSYIYAFYFLLEKKSKFQGIVMFFLFLGTLFCIYKAVTRTVIFGGIFFWFTFLFFWKRKLFFLVLIVFISGMAWNFDSIREIVTQENAISQVNRSKGVDMNAAGSGRFGIWQHNFKLFSELPFSRQLIGVGLGNELDAIPGTTNKKFYGSHNDYISLLITSGIIGLVLYLVMYCILFFYFVTAPVSISARIYCLSMLLSVMLMNSVSNSYIVRFQMAQLFWFLMGFLLAKFSAEKNKKPGTGQNKFSDLNAIVGQSLSRGKKYAG